MATVGLFCVLLSLIVSGPRKNAKSSVNDKLHSYTVVSFCLRLTVALKEKNSASVFIACSHSHRSRVGLCLHHLKLLLHQ